MLITAGPFRQRLLLLSLFKNTASRQAALQKWGAPAMSMSLEQTESVTEMWCGRSWEGLVDRRCDAFTRAQELRRATEEDALDVVTAFLEFFDTTGDSLFRDEEEWILRSLDPVPEAVSRALEGHITISSLVTSLFHEAEAGCVDVRVVHALGELLESHLLLEEEEVRPLVKGNRSLLSIAP